MRLLAVDAEISNCTNTVATLLAGSNLIMGTVVLVKIGKCYEIIINGGI